MRGVHSKAELVGCLTTECTRTHTTHILITCDGKPERTICWPLKLYRHPSQIYFLGSIQQF